MLLVYYYISVPSQPSPRWEYDQAYAHDLQDDCPSCVLETTACPCLLAPALITSVTIDDEAASVTDCSTCSSWYGSESGSNDSYYYSSDTSSESSSKRPRRLLRWVVGVARAIRGDLTRRGRRKVSQFSKQR